MAHHSNEIPEVEVQPRNEALIKQVWRVTIILSVVTAIEFIFAFIMDAGTVRTSIFLVLTIVKAYYIVSEFMHLGHEERGLKLSVLVPLLTLVWLLGALMIQAH